MKCVPFIPRQGKKILFILVTINVVVIWFIYKKSNYISYFSPNTLHVTTNSVYSPLYNVPVFHIPLLYTKDLAPYYTEVNTNIWCLHQGIDLKESKRNKKCVCLSNWFGLDCGIPSAVWKSEFMQEGKNAGVEIRRRDKPRRIILSIVFEDAFDMLDIYIRNTFSIVDVYLVAEEQNHTDSAYNMFKKGYLAKFQNKIMPVQLNKTIVHNDEYQWMATMFEELWVLGWNKLSDFRPDDIFIFSHMYSLVSKDILLFLKLYDGYPEPFYFTLRPLLFKFTKLLRSSNANLTLVPFKPSGCTFQFISTMCEYSISKLFLGNCMKNKARKKFFEKKHWSLKEWTIGNEDFPSGWQCNFCCSAKCILKSIKKQTWLQKISASLSLNYQSVNVSVIENFLRQNSIHGSDITYETIPKSDSYFAPDIMINCKKYLYLLD